VATGTENCRTWPPSPEGRTPWHHQLTSGHYQGPTAGSRRGVGVGASAVGGSDRGRAARSGRPVTISAGRHSRVPRRYGAGTFSGDGPAPGSRPHHRSVERRAVCRSAPVVQLNWPHGPPRSASRRARGARGPLARPVDRRGRRRLSFAARPALTRSAPRRDGWIGWRTHRRYIDAAAAGEYASPADQPRPPAVAGGTARLEYAPRWHQGP